MIDVTCAIIVKKDKILVAQRSVKMYLPLKWEFPGGKVKKNETEEDSIIRELKEELNIYVKITHRLKNRLFDYGDIKINLIPFIVKYVDGDVCILEHNDVKWLNKSELINLDWAAADISVLKEFLSYNYDE